MFYKNLILKFLIIIFSIIWLCYYPFQRISATYNFSKYIKAQGIKKSNINKIKIFKDYLINGYSIHIIYKDDPGLKYSYKWYSKKKYKNYKYNINLIIYKDNLNNKINSSYKDTIVPKHPKL